MMRRMLGGFQKGIISLGGAIQSKGVGLGYKLMGQSDEFIETAVGAIGHQTGTKLRHVDEAVEASEKASNAYKNMKNAAAKGSAQDVIKEAKQPQLAGRGTDMYFNVGDVEYRRRLNPEYDPNTKRQSSDGLQGRYIYESKRGENGNFTQISRQAFGRAKKNYGGDIYASHEDMMLGISTAQDVAEAAAGDGNGIGLMNLVQDHPYVAMSIAAGGGILAANLLDDDY